MPGFTAGNAQTYGDQDMGINWFLRNKASKGAYKKQTLYLSLSHFKYSRNLIQLLFLVVTKTPLLFPF